jgi:hypothetical protein
MEGMIAPGSADESLVDQPIAPGKRGGAEKNGNVEVVERRDTLGVNGRKLSLILQIVAVPSIGWLRQFHGDQNQALRQFAKPCSLPSDDQQRRKPP